MSNGASHFAQIRPAVALAKPLLRLVALDLVKSATCPIAVPSILWTAEEMPYDEHVGDPAFSHGIVEGIVESQQSGYQFTKAKAERSSARQQPAENLSGQAPCVADLE